MPRQKSIGLFVPSSIKHYCSGSGHQQLYPATQRQHLRTQGQAGVGAGTSALTCRARAAPMPCDTVPGPKPRAIQSASLVPTPRMETRPCRQRADRARQHGEYRRQRRNAADFLGHAHHRGGDGWAPASASASPVGPWPSPPAPPRWPPSAPPASTSARDRAAAPVVAPRVCWQSQRHDRGPGGRR